MNKGEPQPKSLSRLLSLQSYERRKHAIAILDRNARSIVIDVENQTARCQLQRNLDMFLRVFTTIGKNISDRTFDQDSRSINLIVLGDACDVVLILDVRVYRLVFWNQIGHQLAQRQGFTGAR